MNFLYNNGGNPKGVDDCVARALAIYLNAPYYDIAQALAPCTVDGGVQIGSEYFQSFMQDRGFMYVPILHRVRVCEMPANCIGHTARHFTAIVDGCVRDVLDTRMEMVLGYWVRGKLFNVVAKGQAVKNSAPLNFQQALTMRRLLKLNYSLNTELLCIS